MNKQNGFQLWEEVYQLHLNLKYGNFGGPESKGDCFEVLHYIFQHSSLTITDILSRVICKRKCSVAVRNRRFVNFERKLRFLFVVIQGSLTFSVIIPQLSQNGACPCWSELALIQMQSYFSKYCLFLPS